MKIAYIIPSLINQGPIIMLQSLVINLIDKVELIDIYYFDENKVVEFPCCTYKIKYNAPINFDQYDIIHTHTFIPDIYVLKWRNHIRSAKLITTLHQDTFVSLGFRYNILAANLLSYYWLHKQNKFDGITTISNQLRDKYKRYIPNKLTTIYNGCNVNFDKTKIKADLEDKIRILKNKHFNILGTYAYITKRKGIHQILEVLPLLTNFALVIIGEGPEIGKLIKITKKLNIAERVIFLPYLTDPYNYLELFDVYMMPSYSEGFGLAMIESALVKKSIVCSDIPSFHELFDKGEVEFFKLDNKASLVNAIKKAYENKNERGELAYKKAHSKFTSSIMADNYYSYYEHLLKIN
jgi:glycosyltransferase involved in cell wall biosynthesis